MRVTLKHSERLVSRNLRDRHHVQLSQFKEAARGFVAQIVESKAFQKPGYGIPAGCIAIGQV